MSGLKSARKEIRKLQGKGKTRRQIEKRTGMDRKTVKRAERQIERRAG